MSAPATPPPSPAANPSPRSPFRFSLFTLLSLTTLAGLVSTIVFSKHWFDDERLLVAFWSAGLIVGLSFGQASKTNGLISGALGAVVGSLLAATLISVNWPIDFSWPNRKVEMPYFAFVVVVGWLAAFVISLIYRAVAGGLLGRLWFNRRVRIALLTIAGCTIAVLIGLQSFQPRPWLPAWRIEAPKVGRSPAIQLSPHGDLLYARYDAPLRSLSGVPSCSIFELSSRGVQGKETPIVSRDVIFSPDGKLILGVGYGTTTCRLFDSKTGKQLRVWSVGFNQSVRQVQFSLDSKKLLMTTMSQRIQRLYEFDVTKDQVPKPQLLPFRGLLLLDPTGERLVKIHLAIDETDAMRAEIVNRQDGTLVGEINDLTTAWLSRQGAIPSFVAGEDQIAFDEFVWKRTGGKAKVVADGSLLVGLVSGDRAVVVANSPQWGWTQAMPYGLRSMPFFRHLWLGQYCKELRIIDVDTGKVLRQSRPFWHVATTISSDGKVVACTTDDNGIRVWKIPEP